MQDRWIMEEAKKLGIDAIGIISIDKLNQVYQQYQVADRFYPQHFFPQAHSVLCAALSYQYDWNQESANSIGYIARYTSANFYKFLYQKLTILGRMIKEKKGGDLSKKEFYKIFVNSRIHDKTAALATGIGSWLKNNCLSINHQGPRFVLGEILFSCQLEEFVGQPEETCVKCQLCIKSCPTQALKPYQLDKKKCLQKLTTERNWTNKEFNDYIKPNWGSRFYGCTTCIDVCPLNKKNPIKTQKENFPGWIGTKVNFDELLQVDSTQIKTYFVQNQLSASWISKESLMRNALLALYHQNRISTIKEYVEKMKYLHWNDEEIGYIKEFLSSYLNIN
ncbi:MAG: DUF1730 domain-containing protein [Spirochaetes bacterium]|nr:DUF1730 domain-containing protein [Spirochaetota bacterium]